MTWCRFLMTGGHAGAPALRQRDGFHSWLWNRVHFQRVHEIPDAVALRLGSGDIGLYVRAQDRLLLRDDATTPEFLVKAAGEWPLRFVVITYLILAWAVKYTRSFLGGSLVQVVYCQAKRTICRVSESQILLLWYYVRETAILGIPTKFETSWYPWAIFEFTHIPYYLWAHHPKYRSSYVSKSTGYIHPSPGPHQIVSTLST